MYSAEILDRKTTCVEFSINQVSILEFEDSYEMKDKNLFVLESNLKKIHWS